MGDAHYKYVLPSPKLQVEFTAWACPFTHAMERAGSKSKFFSRETKHPKQKTAWKLGKLLRRHLKQSISHKDSIPDKYFLY